MKKTICNYMIIILTAVSFACSNVNFLDKADERLSFPSSGAPVPSGDDVISATTNHSDKKDETSPKLNPFEGAGFIKPPQINNYGAVSLNYEIDIPPGRAGMQPGTGLSYSSSGGDGLVGIGWNLSTGLGVISRTTSNGQLYYDYRDVFTFNGKRLVKVNGDARIENGEYRLEIESGFSKFVLSDAENGGVWRVYDKGGTVTEFGVEPSERIYLPADPAKTYIWNFTRTYDLNGNFMYAVYDDSDYEDKHILYLKEIRYTGNIDENMPARQYVRFTYRDRDEAYVSKAPGFIMEMDRLLNTIEVGWDDPKGWSSTVLWTYTMIYEISEDSNRPLLKTIESTKESTQPEFIYQPAVHNFVWSTIYNQRYTEPEINPDATKYFEGDFNGDGISDMVFFNPENGNWRAMEGNRNGGYFEKYYANGFQGYDGLEKIQWFKGNVTGDYNGDGRSDIAFYLPKTGEFIVAEHNGKTFNFRSYGKLILDLDIFKCEWFTGDYDGNGLSDAVLFNEPAGEWYLMTNEGGSFEFIKFSQAFQNLFRSDYSPNSWNMGSEITSDTSEYGKDRGKIHFQSGDYNGDGRTDISIYDERSGKWWVAENYRVESSKLQVSSEVEFELAWKLYKEFDSREMELFAPSEKSVAGNDRFSGDFNGDGFSDFLIFHQDTGEWIIGQTGNGTINFRVFSRTPKFKEVTRWLQGDFNGDGRTDIGFFSKTDNNFWVGEAIPDGFRYSIYSNLEYGPDPKKVLATPHPKDEVELQNRKAVIASDSKTTVIDYQFDANYYQDRGEKVFPGYFTQSSEPELLIYKRKDRRIFKKSGDTLEDILGHDITLEGNDSRLLFNGKARPYGDRGGIYYHTKTTSITGAIMHRFNVIHNTTTGFKDTIIAEFNDSEIDFDIDKNFFMVDQFTGYDNKKYLMLLDDSSDVPEFKLFLDHENPEKIAIGSNEYLKAEDFKNLRDSKNSYMFLSGKFISRSSAQLLFLDMREPAHRWYLGVITGSTISFTRLSGTPMFMKDGYTGDYHVAFFDNSTDIIYATAGEGRTSFHVLTVGPSSIEETNYSALAKGITFQNEYDHQHNPVVYIDTGAKKAVLGNNVRLEDLSAPVKIDRPDLMEQVYPFQWIQGDYNGDGKTDIGIFHLKERNWYFALTQGTVPDMINQVKNGIGGTYHFEYENSTRFDNTGDDDIPDLPINYKVCVGLTMEDGLGRSILTRYEYSDGYAFSGFIKGYKETDYFGFGRFTIIDALGKRNVSEYYNVPYTEEEYGEEYFLRNRVLAGAIKTSRTYGTDNVEYNRTEYEYKLHDIVPPDAPLTPKGWTAKSFLVEPVKVKKYIKGTLVETRNSSIDLAEGKYEMLSKLESVTDHYQDGVHSPVTVHYYSKFDNIESTNEMRLIIKGNLLGTAYETDTYYHYDSNGNLIKEKILYPKNSLPPVEMRVRNYKYDGYGNRIEETDSSGSPSRVVEKVYDNRLHQFPVEDRAIGDSINLTTKYDINYETAFGGMNQKTDPNGNSTYFEYDSIGRLKVQKADINSGIETLNEYSYSTDFPLSVKMIQHASAPASSSQAGAIETRIFADGMGRVIHSVRSASNEAGKKYVRSGKLVYDAAGRLIRKSQAEWAGDNEIDRFNPVYPEKYPTITEYDPSGRVKKIILPEGYKGEPETSVTTVYNDPWEVITYHSVGRSKRTIKNARGQTLYIEEKGVGDDGEAVSAAIGFSYDIAGNRVKKMDLTPLPGAHSFVNGEEVTPPAGMSLDIPGELFQPGVKDESGKNIAVWKYDAFGQKRETSDPDMGYSKLEYNAFGNVVSSTDGLNRTTDMYYDRLGRPTEKHLPGNEGVVQYIYDRLEGCENALGRMVALDDPAQRKEFSYDELGRIKKEIRIIKIEELTASCGQMPSPPAPLPGGEGKFVTEFTYDLLGRQTSINYPTDPKSGLRMRVDYGYSAFGVQNIQIDNGNMTKSIVNSIDYNEFGQTTEIHRGNNTATYYEYDIKGRLTNLLTASGENGLSGKLQDVSYKFKTDNSIKWIENRPSLDPDGAFESTVRYEYSYDGLNRLVRASGFYDPTSSPSPLLEGEGDYVNPSLDSVKRFERGYSYSPNGNLSGKTIFNPETQMAEDQWTYSYSNHAATEIHTTKSGLRFIMEYDPLGNMTSQRDNEKSLSKEMTYDSHNRIRRVSDPDTGDLHGQYWYDDQGFRVFRVARYEVESGMRESAVIYPSIFFGIEAAWDSQGHLVTETGYGVNNIYLNGVRIAAALPNGDARYYLTDQVDSVKVVADEQGKVLTRTEYFPYGETWFQEGDEKNAPKYNSQELDRESGFYFYNARHYDGEIGRFVTPDTVIDGEWSVSGWNRFMYVHGNPIRYRDPTGHTPENTTTLSQAGKNFDEFATNVKEQLIKNTQPVINNSKNSLARRSHIDIGDKRIYFQFTETFCESWAKTRTPEQAIKDIDKNVLAILVKSAAESEVKGFRIEGLGRPEQTSSRNPHGQLLGKNITQKSWGIDITGIAFDNDLDYNPTYRNFKEKWGTQKAHQYDEFINTLKENSQLYAPLSKTFIIDPSDYRQSNIGEFNKWNESQTSVKDIHYKKPHLHFSIRDYTINEMLKYDFKYDWQE